MRLTRIYQPGELHPGAIIHLSKAASQHIGLVLRMKVEDKFILFNGNNHEYYAKITTLNKRQVSAFIETAKAVNRESNLRINLAQGISKGDKMDLVIQKAVELGVTTIIPIVSSHCAVNLSPERLNKKYQQWQDQIISACEQCGRNFLPQILEPCKLDNFFTNFAATNKYILSPSAEKSWHEYAKNPLMSSSNLISENTKEITILIGPEGGFSYDELKFAEKFNFNPVKLGPRILRTETAAITTIGIIQAFFGDI